MAHHRDRPQPQVAEQLALWIRIILVLEASWFKDLLEAETNPRKTVGNPLHSTSAPPVRELEHPERKLTILMISTAIIFAFIGTVLGVLTLAHLSGIPTSLGLGFFPSHPYLQIYGFIGEFVVGVAYSLLPRFKTTHVPEITAGYATYGLMTAANALFLILPALASYASVLGPLATLLLLGGSAIFASQVSFLAFHSGGGFPETNPLMVLSSLSLVLISLLLFLQRTSVMKIGSEIFSSQVIFLALLGFAGSMVYTVEIRSVSFRQSNYRKRIANLSWKFQAVAIAITFAGVFLPLGSSFLSVVGGALFLAAALSVILSIRIFELAHPLMYRPAMTKMHFRIVRYNEVCILSGSLWLIFGCVLGIVLNVQQPQGAAFFFFLRDSFIHSIAIGFIGSAITVFAPMLLPSLLGRKAPVSGLSFGPIALLNAGILVRVTGDSTTTLLSLPNLPVWESASGPLVLGAMIWLLLVLPRIGKQPHEQEKKKALQKRAVSAENPVEAVRNERDAVITVTKTGTDILMTLNVWFIEKDGDIYLLPSKGAQTKWYRDVVATPTLKLSIGKTSFSGKAKVLNAEKEVNLAIKLFKDKYGDRTYRNFYDDRVDRAIKVASIEKVSE